MPLPDGFEHVACDLCGRDDSQRSESYYAFDGTVCYLVKCPGCGLIYVNPRPRPERLALLYDEDYFTRGYTGCINRDITKRLGGLGGAARVLDLLEPWKKRKRQARILEIGCADGFFLELARERGWIPYGVEVSDYAAEYARAKRGLDVFTGTLEDTNLPSETFVAVYMGDVLAHLASPSRTLRGIYRVLAPGGGLVTVEETFYGGFYCTISRGYLYLRKLFTGEDHQIEEPRCHYYEFTSRTLRSMLEGCGFQVLESDSFEGTEECKILQSPVRAGVRLLSRVASLLPGVGARTLVLAKRTDATE